MKKAVGILVCLLALMVCAGALGEITASDRYGNVWKLSNDGILTISGTSKIDSMPVEISTVYFQNVKEIVIENGIPGIGSDPFDHNDNLTKLTLPNSITYIGSFAFSYCSKLDNVTIPTSVTEIGSCAFERCTSLSSITIPDSVTTLGANVFLGCTSLKKASVNARISSINFDGLFLSCTSLESITISSAQRHYCAQDGIVYNIDKTEIIYCPIAKAGKVEIPYGVTKVPAFIFAERKNLTSVTLPNSITYIGKDAFKGCSSLTSVIIPDSVTEIGNSAFSGCSSLTSITIPNSVKDIMNAAFSGCSSLRSIRIPDNVAIINTSVFEGCSSLSSVIIPDSVTWISGSAFDGCSSLSDITIPKDVYWIDIYAFRSCSLTKVTLPQDIEYIGPVAFDKTVFLRVAKGSYAEQWAYNNYYEYETYEPGTEPIDPVNPDPVNPDPTNTGEDEMITSLTVKGVKYKLSGSTATATGPEKKTAKTITIQDKVTANGKDYKVTAIKDKAFQKMTKLTKVTIGKNVKTIGKNAFYNCKKLKTIKINSKLLTEKKTGKNAFKGIYKKATITCPKGKAKTYKKWLTKKAGVPKTAKIK